MICTGKIKRYTRYEMLKRTLSGFKTSSKTERKKQAIFLVFFLNHKKNISFPCKLVTNGSLVTMDFLCYSKHLGAIKSGYKDTCSLNFLSDHGTSNNPSPIARHQAFQMMFHLILQNKGLKSIMCTSVCFPFKLQESY